MIVDNYLKRIGLDRPKVLDRQSLEAILKHSARTIPFENLDIHLGKSIIIDDEAVIDKILNQGRGGYCYEVNGLLSLVLKELGFKTGFLGARTIFGYNELRPVTHMILKVDIDSESYLCDLGFTGMNSITPIAIGSSSEVKDYYKYFRLQEDKELGYILQVKNDQDKWNSLYSFDMQPYKKIDFELANYFNSTSEKSICTRQLICSINTEEGSIRLVGNELKIRSENVSEDRVITTKEQLQDTLENKFKIFLTPSELQMIFDKFINK